MFTGIISAVGKIVQLEERQGDKRLNIDTGNSGSRRCSWLIALLVMAMLNRSGDY